MVKRVFLSASVILDMLYFQDILSIFHEPAFLIKDVFEAKFDRIGACSIQTGIFSLIIKLTFAYVVGLYF